MTNVSILYTSTLVALSALMIGCGQQGFQINTIDAESLLNSTEEPTLPMTHTPPPTTSPVNTTPTIPIDTSIIHAPKGFSEVGFTIKNGIEPGNPNDCEAPATKKCYYVDAQASNGGDGSYIKPYNSFEKLVGYLKDKSYYAGRIQGGDYIYLKGTFTYSSHDEISNNLKLYFSRSHQGGSSAQPTVIKSYLGTPRAVFDGQHTQSNLIRISRGEAYKIQNIEIKRAKSIGIAAGDGIKHFRINNLYIHQTTGDGNIGVGGAIVFKMQTTVHDFEIKNSVFIDNSVNASGYDGNIGTISILSEKSAKDGSEIVIKNNYIDGGGGAIRHKHSGNIKTIAFNNVIKNHYGAFFVRAYMGNILYNNIITGTKYAVRTVSDAQGGPIRTDFYNNTMYDVDILMDTGGGGDRSDPREFYFTKNILYKKSSGYIFELGLWASAGKFKLSQLHSSDNLLYSSTIQTDDLVRSNGYNIKGLQPGLEAINDSGSIFADPQFMDADNEDFRLKASSPASGWGVKF